MVHFGNPENFFGGSKDAFSAYCTICGGGCIMFFGITALIVFSNKKWRKAETLRETGIRRDMVVVDLKVDPAGNDQSFGWVVCQEPGESENPKRYKSMKLNYLLLCETLSNRFYYFGIYGSTESGALFCRCGFCLYK